MRVRRAGDAEGAPRPMWGCATRRTVVAHPDARSDAMIKFTLATILAGGAAAAAGLAGAQAAPSANTMTFTAKPTGGAGLDLGRKGPSVGDQFFEHGRVTGAAAGRFQLVTQLVAGNGRHGTEQNAITLLLRDGTIASAGAHGTVDRFSMPVVGGTGAYEGARGVLSVSPGRHGAETMTVSLDD
jgi:hypothetical protein